MVLWVDSDASYLSEPKARSRSAGIFYLSDPPKGDPIQAPPLNGPIFALVLIMKNVLGSAMEAKVGALYNNAREACPMRVTLEELGHLQPPTPLKVDNQTVVDFTQGTMKHKRSKAIDMQFH